MTEWRKVHAHYEVNADGEVRSLPHVDRRGRPWPGKILRPFRTGKGEGYLTVSIDGKNRKVHRLVADAFLAPDAQRTQINHDNGNKAANNIGNLERCTGQENVLHAWRSLGRKPSGGHAGKSGALHHTSKPIVAQLPDGSARRFGSAAEAARSLSLRRESVVRVANGVYRHTGGCTFTWA